MTLSDCPECGHRVSPDDPTCPQCGVPLHRDLPFVPARTDSHGGDPETGGHEPAGSGEPSEEGWLSRRPTWLLFVLVFVGGSVVLVAGAVAAVVVAGALLGESEDSNIAATFLTLSGETTTTVVAGDDNEIVDDPEDSITTTAPTILAGDKNGLSVGQCIDDDEFDKYLAGDDFSLVSCGDPHDAEIYYVHEFRDGPYLGRETLSNELTPLCTEAFWAYVGPDFDYETPALHVFQFVPTQGGWESGDRRAGECALADSNSNKLTRSEYRRSGKAIGWPPRRNT